MNYEDRVRAVTEIGKLCKRRNHNITTLLYLMAGMTNKAFDKFYADYTIKKETDK